MIGRRQAYRFLYKSAGTLLYNYRKFRSRNLSSQQLQSFENSVFSQNGEDGILEEIFRRIRTTNRFFLEFGIEHGMECNAALLARKWSWGGVMLEGSPHYYKTAVRNYRKYPNVVVANEFITVANIGSLCLKYNIPLEFDLLSIDIDGNDYWIWQALEQYKPRVVVIEYNAAYPPPASVTMAYKSDHVWNGSTAYGASLTALERLGFRMGYSLIGTDSTGNNAFFLRDDLVKGSGFERIPAELAYHQSSYFRFHLRHAYAPGKFEEV